MYAYVCTHGLVDASLPAKGVWMLVSKIVPSGVNDIFCYSSSHNYFYAMPAWVVTVCVLPPLQNTVCVVTHVCSITHMLMAASTWSNTSWFVVHMYWACADQTAACSLLCRGKGNQYPNSSGEKGGGCLYHVIGKHKSQLMTENKRVYLWLYECDKELMEQCFYWDCSNNTSKRVCWELIGWKCVLDP